MSRRGFAAPYLAVPAADLAAKAGGWQVAQRERLLHADALADTSAR